MRYLAFALAAAASAAILPASSLSAHQDTPAAAAARNLAVPPDNAQLWLTMAGDQERGRHYVWRDAAGVLWTRQSTTRSGFFSEVDQRIVTGPNGLVTESEVRGATTQGAAAESYSASGGYVTPADRGPAAPAGSFYLPYEVTLGAQIALVDALLRAPSRSLPLHPGGTARISELTRASATNGRETKQLVAYAVDSCGPTAGAISVRRPG